MDHAIEIFQFGNQIEIKVRLDEDTVWLTQTDMASLFDCSADNISLHLKNIYAEGELDEKSTTEDFSVVRQEGKRQVRRKLTFYNLDAIISVGYRVKSRIATRFRQWATQRLKDFLVQGYAINEKRLAQKEQEIRHLKNGIQILHRAIELELETSENTTLALYSKGLSILDDYDHEGLDQNGVTKRPAVYPTTADYLQLIQDMYSDFDSDVFAKPKDDSFDSSVNQIKQSFGEEELYPSLEEKAGTLLYLIVKNHSFIDGNKRIAAACFLYFLDVNQRLKTEDGALIISNEALAALTLFIATSKPEEMETVKRLTLTILNRAN